MFKHFLFSSTLFFFFAACSPPFAEEKEIDLSSYKIDSAFKLEVIASEPLINAPVAMDFDDQGRIWVLEMPDYMPDIDGEGESEPQGRIVILEDQDGNGRMDKAIPFLTDLAQPRAIALVYGGLLYAESPNLWFVEIDNDRPGKKVLVDSSYAIGGNVEHQPNTLLLGLDNWIYSAKSHYRYRRSQGIWIKEVTSFRGQWGLTQDPFGRLYANDNSNPIYGDLCLPNTLIKDSFYAPGLGVMKNLAPDRRVFPRQATAVNRGYQQGMLDEAGVLQNTTSSCSPMILSLDGWPNTTGSSAYVCHPEVNLINRYEMDPSLFSPTLMHGHPNSSFLSSTDEGFRPVNLQQGLDASFYVVDFHRGVIQHKVYMTNYLHDKIKEKNLDSIVGMGRLLRVSRKGAEQKPNINFSKLNTYQLLDLLNSENQILRTKAQYLLIERGKITKKELLSKFKSSKKSGRLHLLYALEGLEFLGQEDAAATGLELLNEINAKDNPWLAAHIINLLPKSTKSNNFSHLKKVINKIAFQHPIIDIHLASNLPEILPSEDELVLDIYEKLLVKYAKNETQLALLHDAIISGTHQSLEIRNGLKNSDRTLAQKIDKASQNRVSNTLNYIYQKPQAQNTMDEKTIGLALFKTHCAACHGLGGQGIENLAPTMLNAAIVDHSAIAIARTVLAGLQGPIHVDGKILNFSATMPGLMQNSEISDEDIANIVTYVSNAYSNNISGINATEIKELRVSLSGQKVPLTEAEILSYQK